MPDPIRRTAPNDVMTLARMQASSWRPMLDALRVSGVPLNADDPKDPPKDPAPKDPPADPPKDPPVTGDAKTAADVARLQAALDAERAQHKTAAKDAKDLKARLDKIEAADASELELATKRADEAEAKLTKATENTRKANLLVALGDSKHGLVSAAAAARLAEGVEYDDNDQPTNVDAVATKLKESFDFLKGTAPAPKPGDINPGGGAGGGGGNEPVLTAEELTAAQQSNMSPAEWAHYKQKDAGPYVPPKT
jgi:hypothetical protein